MNNSLGRNGIGDLWSPLEPAEMFDWSRRNVAHRRPPRHSAANICRPLQPINEKRRRIQFNDISATTAGSSDPLAISFGRKKRREKQENGGAARWRTSAIKGRSQRPDSDVTASQEDHRLGGHFSMIGSRSRSMECAEWLVTDPLPARR